VCREIGNLLPNNRRQRRTCYALCHILYPVSAAHTSIFRMDSNSTSYILCAAILGLHSLRQGGVVFSRHETKAFKVANNLDTFSLLQRCVHLMVFIGDPYTHTWAHAITAAGSQATSTGS